MIFNNFGLPLYIFRVAIFMSFEFVGKKTIKFLSIFTFKMDNFRFSKENKGIGEIILIHSVN